MPTPIVILNKKEWSLYMRHFCETIVYLCDKDNLQKTEIVNLLKDYEIAINDKTDVLFEQAARDITIYLRLYGVRPTNFQQDEFKGVYFLSRVIADYLKNIGLETLSILQLRACSHLLNKRLERSNAARRQLYNAIEEAIKHNRINDDFGKYGWYIVCKCLCNAAEGLNKAH